MTFYFVHNETCMCLWAQNVTKWRQNYITYIAFKGFLIEMHHKKSSYTDKVMQELCESHNELKILLHCEESQMM